MKERRRASQSQPARDTSAVEGKERGREEMDLDQPS